MASELADILETVPAIDASGQRALATRRAPLARVPTTRAYKQFPLPEPLRLGGLGPMPEVNEGRGWLGAAWGAVQPVFDAFEFIDKATRLAVGKLLGLEPQSDWAPTGEELYEHITGIQLPPGTPGKPEWRDVGPFLTEMLVSAVNVLGVGTMAKAARGAQRLARLQQRARALTVSGVGATRAGRKELEHIGQQVAKLLPEVAGQPALGRTLAEQGRLGQRALLGIDIPFGPKIPLGGRRLNELLLGGVEMLGRGVARPFRPLERYFRVGARLPKAMRPVRAGVEMTTEEFNAAVDAAESALRAGMAQGIEEGVKARRAIGGWSLPVIEKAMRDLPTAVGPELTAAVAAEPRVAALARRLERAQRSRKPDAAKIAGLERSLETARTIAKERLLGLGDLERRDPRVAAWLLGAQETPRVRKKLAAESARRVEAAGRQMKLLQQLHGFATQAGDIKRAATLQAQMTRLANRTADEVAYLAAAGRLNAAIWANLPPEVRREALRVGAVSSRVLKIERQAGVPVSELTDVFQSYLHRAITPEGREFIQQLQSLGLRDPNLAGMLRFARGIRIEASFLRRRMPQWDGYGIATINDRMLDIADQLRARGHKITFGLSPEHRFFSEEPGEIMLRRLAAGGRARHAAHVHTSAIELLSVPASAAAEGDMPIAEYLAKARLGRIGEKVLPREKEATRIARALQGTAYEGRYMPRDFANELLRLEEVINNAPQMNRFSRLLDQYLATMRFHVTVPFPAYHIRNAVSNLYLMWLAGFKRPRLLWRAARLMRDAGRAARDPRAPEHAQKALRELREMQRLGAYAGTLTMELAAVTPPAPMGPTLARLIERGGAPGRAAVAAARLATAPTETALGQRLMGLGAAIENHAKVALYLDGIESGLSRYEAAERVRKYLYDYRAISPFEKRTLRRWAFFYTWMRKNTALMLERAALDPRKMRLYHLTAGQSRDAAAQEMLMPYELTRGPIALPWGPKGERVFATLDLPPTDIALLSAEGERGWGVPRRLAQKIGARAAPLAQALYTLLSGQQLATGKPVTVQRALAGVTPASRYLTTAQHVAEVLAGERPGFELARYAGVGLLRADPKLGRLRRDYARIGALLENLALQGRVKRWTGYAAAEGLDADTAREIERLTQIRRRLEAELSRARRRRR